MRDFKRQEQTVANRAIFNFLRAGFESRIYPISAYRICL